MEKRFWASLHLWDGVWEDFRIRSLQVKNPRDFQISLKGLAPLGYCHYRRGITPNEHGPIGAKMGCHRSGGDKKHETAFWIDGTISLRVIHVTVSSTTRINWWRHQFLLQNSSRRICGLAAIWENVICQYRFHSPINRATLDFVGIKQLTCKPPSQDHSLFRSACDRRVLNFIYQWTTKASLEWLTFSW